MNPYVTTPKIAVLGMMSRIPVPGVIWQTVHYLIGLQRLGFDVHYVEDNGMTPRAFFDDDQDDGWRRAADFVGSVMREFGFAEKWAIHAEHSGRRHFGMSASELEALYRSAALIINLHGSTTPRPEHAATGRLVFLETDPVELQVEIASGVPDAIGYLEAHCAFFSFGENYGRPGCLLPVTPRFEFHPTRQPVVLDLWDDLAAPTLPAFTTIGNWQQSHRQVVLDGETYHWSKDREFAKFINLPERTGESFELALSSCDGDARTYLERHGWRLRPPFLDVGQLHDYRRYIATSKGEFTVAKDQNVRLHTGWFSDRSATYLASGRPVITQDTGFGDNLPVGAGLFAVATEDEAVDATIQVAREWGRHSRAASAIAREHFDASVVLTELLDTVGLSPARRTKAPTSFGVPPELNLTTWSRWPTRILDTTADAMGRLVQRRCDEAQGRRVLTRAPAPSVSIVIPVRDNVVFTAMCLETLLADTGGPDFEVVVVDNGSTDATPAYLEAVGRLDARVRPVSVPEHLGFAKACNLGLEESRGSTIVLLNNDTITTPGWLETLLTHLQVDSEACLVGPVTNHTCNEAQVSVTYRTYGELLQAAARRSQDLRGGSFEISMLAMFCIAGARTTFDKLGPLDEGYGMGLFEDDDYSERARELGIRLVCAEDVLVHHFGEVSLGAQLDPEEYLSLFEVNRARFESRWGRAWRPHDRRVDPDYRRLRAEVRRTIGAVVPKRASVLVASKGDDALLELPDMTAWHFPGAADGSFLGEYPADSQAAIGLLESQIEAGGDHLVFPATAAWWLVHYAGLHAYLQAQHGSPVHDDEICRIWALGKVERRSPVERSLLDLVARQADDLARLGDELVSVRDQVLALTMPVASTDAEGADGAALVDTWRALDALMQDAGASKRTRYLLLRTRFRDAVLRSTAPGSTVAVISHGDPKLLELHERGAWHVPRMEDGQWSAGLPLDSEAAIEEVARLSALGADYLALPSPYGWWLDHYQGLAQHLARRAVVVFSDPELGWVWDLGTGTGRASDGSWPLEAVLAEARARLRGDELSVLDWDTGLDLAARLDDLVVFSPPVVAERLPYLSGTVDLVVLASADPERVGEAQRVARAGVVQAASVGGGAAHFWPEWLIEEP